MRTRGRSGRRMVEDEWEILTSYVRTKPWRRISWLLVFCFALSARWKFIVGLWLTIFRVNCSINFSLRDCAYTVSWLLNESNWKLINYICYIFLFDHFNYRLNNNKVKLFESTGEQICLENDLKLNNFQI